MSDFRGKTPADAARVCRFTHEAMACTFGVALLERDAVYARQAADAAFAEVDRLEQELSRFIDTSDVARINALSPGETVVVGIDTLACLRLADRLCRETRGAFDVAFRTPPGESGGPPLVVDPAARTVAVTRPGVRIDLGGIGKGYAVDQMAAMLRAWSIGAGLIHAGQSSVYALGYPPHAEAWTVPLRHPDAPDREIGRAALRDRSLSGSGCRLHGHHIIDPRGGEPVMGKRAAWAVARSAAVSDALATAAMVMTPDEIAAYCSGHGDVALAYVTAETPPQAIVTGRGLCLDMSDG